MESGSLGKLLRATTWYLRFFNLWAISLAMFFVYLYTYDRFRVNIGHPLLFGEHPLAGEEWIFLLSNARTELEPLLATTHMALISAILFSFEEGEGISYVKYLSGVGRLASYVAKLLAALLLFTLPLATAKLTVILSWDYRALWLPSSYMFLNFVSNLVLYATYIFSVYGLFALLIRRPVYFLASSIIELYVFEPKLSLLGARPMYLYASLTHPLALLPTPRGTVLAPPYALLLLFPQRFTLALACALLTLLYYRFRGEVKWR